MQMYIFQINNFHATGEGTENITGLSEVASCHQNHHLLAGYSAR